MGSSQMPANKQFEQLLACPLEDLACLAADGPAEACLHSARLLRLLLSRVHQVINDAGKKPKKIHLQVLTKLFRLIPPRPPAAFMALALQDKLALFEKAFQTGMAASDGPAASEAADLLLTMLPLFKDMISWTVKDTTSKRRGRDILGQAFIPPTMNFLDCLLRDETKAFAPWDTVVLQREAVTTVVDLVVGHPANAACLLGLTDLCISVFTECLSTCGDFGVQVDIIDLLYRCAKHGNVPDSYLTAFSGKAKEDFRQSLTQDFTEEGPESFDAALCRHAHAAHLHAGSFSRIAYVTGIVASGMLQPAPHEGFYVGSACISFYALRGKQESQPYLVSFPLEELINLRCTLTPDKSQLILSADLNQVHNTLECICNPSEQRTPELILTFARPFAVKVATVAPQLHAVIRSATIRKDPTQETKLDEHMQRPAQQSARQKVSWGIPVYAPLTMEPSCTIATTANRSRLSLQPVRRELPVSNAHQSISHKDPIDDTEVDGPALPIPLEVDGDAGGTHALDLNESELQCGQKDPFLASDGEEIQEPNRKVPDAPRISDEFMVMPSFTTAAEQGQRSSTPDVTSQPPNPDNGLQTIDEGPEQRHDDLHAPGQLSDADEEEPWIPNHPHKPKAARKINFDLHAAADTQIEDAPALTENQQPADLPAEHAKPDKAADREMAQTGHRKASEQKMLRGMQDATNQSDPANVRYLQSQIDLHDSLAKKAAPAKAQRRMKQAAQRMQPDDGLERCTEKDEGKADPQKAKAKLAPCKDVGAAQQAKKTPKGNRASNSGAKQTAKEAQKSIPRPSKTPAHMADQVEDPASGRKALRTQPETDPTPEKDKVPAAAITYARASPHPKSITKQADNNRPMGRPDPSAPLDLHGRQDLLPTQQASTDHGEASNITSSDRSDGFTQALQKLQEANNAHLQKMAGGLEAQPAKAYPVHDQETAAVMHASKEVVYTEERPDSAKKKKRKTAAKHKQPGAQQAAKQQETPQDDAAVDAMHLDEGMHETPEDAPKAPKQKPVRKAAAKKAPVKRSARKAKPAKAPKGPKAAAQAAGKKRQIQTPTQMAAAAHKQSPELTDPEISDEDPSMHQPPARPKCREVRQRQEEMSPEPNIVVELEKENVGWAQQENAGFSLPDAALPYNLQPVSTASSGEDPLALAEQPGNYPQGALMGLPDLPFMQMGLQQTPGLQPPKMPVLATAARCQQQTFHPTGRLTGNAKGKFARGVADCYAKAEEEEEGKLKGKVKRTPAGAVAERYDETDEEDEENAEAGLTLKALAQMASGADSDDEEECMEEVQLVLKRIMTQKKTTTRKKVAHLEQAARDQISALVSTCATVIQKEEKAAQATLSKVASQHEANIRQHEQRMQDAHAAYQAAVAAEWAELQKTICSQAKALQDAQTAQTKRQAGHKRKLAEMDQQAAVIIAETEAKVKRMCKKAGRMSSLAKILQPFTQAKSSPFI